MNVRIYDKGFIPVLMFLGVLKLGVTIIAAGPGNLDPTFSGHGNLVDRSGRAHRVAVRSDGKIMAAGHSRTRENVNGGNDLFADATVIPANVVSFTDTGSIVGATGEPGEPGHDPGTGSLPLNSHWWTWTPATSGPTTVRVLGNFSAVWAVYTGESVDALTKKASARGLSTDSLTFEAAAGITYHIAVDGFLDQVGDYTLILNQGNDSANDDFEDATVIPAAAALFFDNGSTVGATGEPGEPNHAGNSIPLASHWWTWTPTTSGPTRIHLHPSAFNPTLGVYTGESVGALTEVVSNDNYFGASSMVTFDAVAGTTYHIAVDGASGETVDYNFTFTRVIPANDNFANATVLDPAQPIITFSGTIRDAIASGEPGEPTPVGIAPLSSVWYRITPTASRTIGLLRNANFGTFTSIYTGSNLGSLTPVEIVRPPTPSSQTQVHVFSVVAGVTYYIRVDGIGNDLGDFEFTLINTPVAVVDRLVVLGGDGKDSVSVSPIGVSDTGSSGVRVQGVINGEQVDRTFVAVFSAFPALFYMADRDDNVQLAPSLAFRTAIHLGEGNNTVISGAGSDEVTAGSGNNRINTGTGNDTVTTGNGNNTVDIFAGSVTTGSGNDVVRGGSGTNITRTGDGNDYIDAGGGDDLVDAGTGNDVVYGGTGNDVLIGSDGHDQLYGGDGHDLLVGGLNGDELFGGDGNDILFAQDLIGTSTGTTLVQLRTKLISWISGGFVTFNTSNLFALDDPMQKFDSILGEEGTDLFCGMDDKDLSDQTEGESTLFLP